MNLRNKGLQFGQTIFEGVIALISVCMLNFSYMLIRLPQSFACLLVNFANQVYLN